MISFFNDESENNPGSPDCIIFQKKIIKVENCSVKRELIQRLFLLLENFVCRFPILFSLSFLNKFSFQTQTAFFWNSEYFSGTHLLSVSLVIERY